MDFNIETAQIIATTIIAISAVLMGVRWQLAKKKLHEVRQLIDVVDDALDDDKVTEDEFRDVVNKLMAVAHEDEIKQIIQTLRAALKF
ncbi:MAG: hypothetical protein OIN66_02400 [Candidatus Methanoperedens sp.]|nr:hypothetical protein [Candidatus Methanoperedens sp.]